MNIEACLIAARAHYGREGKPTSMALKLRVVYKAPLGKAGQRAGGQRTVITHQSDRRTLDPNF